MPMRVPPLDLHVDLDILTDVAESFFLSEVRKRILASHFCSVLCETASDKDTMANCGGIILPSGQMSLYVTFTPSMEDAIRISLAKEVRIALRSHKTLFYQGDLVLKVTSSISLPPVALFQMALLTLLCLYQGDMGPTPTKIPRTSSDVIADVTHRGTHHCFAACCFSLQWTSHTALAPSRGPHLPSLMRTTSLSGSHPATSALSGTTRPSRFARELFSMENRNPSLWGWGR